MHDRDRPRNLLTMMSQRDGNNIFNIGDSMMSQSHTNLHHQQLPPKHSKHLNHCGSAFTNDLAYLRRPIKNQRDQSQLSNTPVPKVGATKPTDGAPIDYNLSQATSPQQKKRRTNHVDFLSDWKAFRKNVRENVNKYDNTGGTAPSSITKPQIKDSCSSTRTFLK